MEKKTDILFDLDGTLTDPMQGITKSVRYALRHFGWDDYGIGTGDHEFGGVCAE